MTAPSDAPMASGAHQLKQHRQWPSIPLAASPETAPPSVLTQPAKLVGAAPCAAAPLCRLKRMARLPQVALSTQGACRSGMWREGKNNPKHSRTKCRVQLMLPTATRVADRGGRRKPDDPKHATHTTVRLAAAPTPLWRSAFPAGARAPAEPAGPGPSNAKSGAPQVRGNGVK
jgi:hypothetical protein